MALADTPSPQGLTLWQRFKSFLSESREGARFEAERRMRADKWENKEESSKAPPSPIKSPGVAPQVTKTANKSLVPVKQSNNLKEKAIAHARAYCRLKELDGFQMEKVGPSYLVRFETEPEMSILISEPSPGTTGTAWGTTFKVIPNPPELKNPVHYAV